MATISQETKLRELREMRDELREEYDNGVYTFPEGAHIGFWEEQKRVRLDVLNDCIKTLEVS